MKSDVLILVGQHATPIAKYATIAPNCASATEALPHRHSRKLPHVIKSSELLRSSATPGDINRFGLVCYCLTENFTAEGNSVQ
jgi:hypothetical protein